MRKEKKPAKKNSSAKKTALVLLVLLLLSGTFTWAMLNREDPQLTKVKELRAQLENAPREQRREMYGQMREEVEKLTPEQRESLFADRRKEWEAREKSQMREFFAMSKQQQIAAIDKDIDRWNNGKGRRRGGPGGGGGGGGGQGGGNGGNSIRPQSFGRDASGASAANNRAKSYLDRTDPDTRAQRTEHRRMVNDRINQRGRS